MKSDDLFSWIETKEKLLGEKAWGKVLDAGTGAHSFKWLHSLSPSVTQIVAVTGEQNFARTIEKESQNSSCDVQVFLGNWTDENLLQGKMFDVILADYLVGALDGFAPYYQDCIFKRLSQHLAPHGRIYVVGLEPLYLTTSTNVNFNNEDANSLLQEVARVRDACILLAGRKCYREYPIEWVQRQLQNDNFTVQNSVKMVNLYSFETIKRQIQVARNQISMFRDATLGDAMRESLDELEKKVKDEWNGTKIRHGFDYIVAAKKEKP